MNILFIIDELEFKYFEFNRLVTNFWLIAEFLKRNYNVFVTVKNKLYLKDNRPHGICRKTTFLNDELFKNDAEETLDLEYFQTIFMRPDPPVDTDYINATYILSLLDKTLCINSPKAIRDKNEKLYVNEFPTLAPKNIVTSDKNLIQDFLKEEGEIIIKPLNRCFSSGVFYLDRNEKNINTIINTSTNDGKTTVMVQKFMPGVFSGDKRLIFIGGEILPYCVVKKGSGGDFKFNDHCDKNLVKGELTKEQLALEAKIGKKLLKDGIFMAGLDVIEDKIIEINITSPCFFIKEINNLFNINLEKIIVDKIETYIKQEFNTKNLILN